MTSVSLTVAPQIVFRPHNAEEVYVTGTFDNWTKSERLDRVGQSFQKTVTLPESDAKIFYKVRKPILSVSV